jgi:hypothetical protein
MVSLGFQTLVVSELGTGEPTFPIPWRTVVWASVPVPFGDRRSSWEDAVWPWVCEKFLDARIAHGQCLWDYTLLQIPGHMVPVMY